MAQQILILTVFVFLIATNTCAQVNGDSKLYPDEKKIANARAVEEEALAKKDSALLAEAYYLYGKAYAHGGLYESADTYFLRSMRIVERSGDSYELGRLYLRLAETETRMTAYDRATQRVLQATVIFERIASKKGLLTAYQLLGYLYRKRADFATAMDYLKKSEKIALELDDKIALSQVYLHLGTHLLKEKKKEGLVYLEKGRRLSESTGDLVSLTNILTNISMGHLDFSNHQDAGIVLAEAKEIFSRIKSPNLTLKTIMQDAAIRYAEKTRNWEEAFKHLVKRRRLDRDHLGAQQDSVIRRLHAEYETEKREALLVAQQNEISLVQNNLRLERKNNYTLLFALCFAVVSLFVLYRLYLKNRRLGSQNAHLLREQGHRIHNHLQMISNMLQLNSGVLSDPEAKATLQESDLRIQSIALLQKGLYRENEGSEIFLSEYFTLLTNHILNVSGYERVQKHIEIAAIFLHPDRALPLALILNELVTNACKYAFPGHPAPQLTIICRQEEAYLQFVLADNGPGFHPPLPGTELSFGMQLIRLQAEQLYATYDFRENPETGGVLFKMEFRI